MDHLKEDDVGGEVQGGRHVELLAGGQSDEAAVIAAHEIFEVDELESVDGDESDDQLDHEERHKVDEFRDTPLPHGRDLEVVEFCRGRGWDRIGICVCVGRRTVRRATLKVIVDRTGV